MVASVPLVDCLDVTTYETHLCGIGLLDEYPFYTPCDVDMLVLLDLCHMFGFLYFFASLHTCLHVHAWVYVSSILWSNGTMGTRSKPTFVLLGHSLLSNNMFVCPCLASLASFSFSALSFYLFLCLSTGLFFFFCHCMYTHGAWKLGVRVRPSRRKHKKDKDASPKRAMFNRLGGLAPPKWSSLSLSLYASSLEHVLGFLFPLYPLLFLLFAWAVFLGYGNVCFTLPVTC